MKINISARLRRTICIAALLALSACSGSTDEGGGGIIIGTGKMLEGTATSNRRFASNEVELRSLSGARATGGVSNQGRFQIEDLDGAGPWLLRRDLGNGTYLYGIATDSSADMLVQNIHSYSDAVVRSWYNTQNLDVDTVFDSTGTASMPTSAQSAAIYNSLIAIVADVLANYDISGVDLNSAEFVANGGGVDAFILENPVIHSDGSITINIFDPDNDFASVAVKDFDLSTDLTAVDLAAPTAPSALRALPSASDEITLVWDVASDNVGIARYAISRNGMEVATSPYPVYVDGGLTSGIEYTYSIVAIDSAGNESGASVPASAEPQAAMDTTPPTTPASVLIDTRRGTLDLTWTQAGIGDVASYAINRGNDPTSPPFYLNVNSTFYFDEAVDAGVRYCYRISAVDASGNQSVPTEVVCARAPGEVVVGGSTTPGPQTPVTPIAGDALTAPQVDVSELACTATLENHTISVDTVIPAGCYVTTRNISVREPANLTLEPGVVIKFAVADSFVVDQGASITARGTAAQPIVLSGTEPTPGHWDGLRISSSSARNEMDHVQIEYAGRNRAGLALVTLSGPARVALSNSTMRFNMIAGIHLDDQIALSTFDRNRFTGNPVPVNIEALSVELLDPNSIYIGNTIDAIVVDGHNYKVDVTWSKMPVPYHIMTNISTTEVFSVEPGTRMMFDEDAGLSALTDGAVKLIGTQEEPISLSGIDEVKGGWKGVFLSFSDDNEMRHVTMQHAGGDGQNAALRIRSSNVTVAQVALENVTITENTGYGIFAEAFTEFTEFENVTVTGNDNAVAVDIYTAQKIDNTVNIVGNDSDAIVLQARRMDDGDVTLTNSIMPYHVTEIDAIDTLTLEAGVTLLMLDGGQIDVGRDGALTANGTAAAPVSIVGFERTPGYWDGIEYRFSNTELNRLTHTLVADGGGDRTSDAANIWLSCSNTSRLILENSQIENSGGYGLFIPPTGCIVDIDTGTTFAGNVLGDRN